MRSVGPAKAFLEALASASVDCIITDPPWALSDGAAFNDVATYKTATAEQIAADLEPGLTTVKPGGHLYTFAPPNGYFLEAFNAIRGSGWKFVQLLAWDKGNRAGMGSWRGTFEPVIIWSNGPAKPFLEVQKHCSTLRYDRPGGRTAKPWQIYKAALEMSVPPGGLAVDPYCGLNPLRKAAEMTVPSRRWAANDVLTDSEVWESRRTHAASFRNRNPKAYLKSGRAVKSGQLMLGACGNPEVARDE